MSICSENKYALCSIKEVKWNWRLKCEENAKSLFLIRKQKNMHLSDKFIQNTIRDWTTSFIFFQRKMFAFSVGVRVHISSVLNWFSFRLHFISANSFRDAFTCIRTVRQNYGVGNCSPESCIALCQRDEQFCFYLFKFCRTIKQTGVI